jgi:hypothetical protein
MGRTTGAWIWPQTTPWTLRRSAKRVIASNHTKHFALVSFEQGKQAIRLRAAGAGVNSGNPAGAVVLHGRLEATYSYLCTAYKFFWFLIRRFYLTAAVSNQERRKADLVCVRKPTIWQLRKSDEPGTPLVSPDERLPRLVTFHKCGGCRWRGTGNRGRQLSPQCHPGAMRA